MKRNIVFLAIAILVASSSFSIQAAHHERKEASFQLPPIPALAYRFAYHTITRTVLKQILGKKGNQHIQKLPFITWKSLFIGIVGGAETALSILELNTRGKGSQYSFFSSSSSKPICNQKAPWYSTKTENKLNKSLMASFSGASGSHGANDEGASLSKNMLYAFLAEAAVGVANETAASCAENAVAKNNSGIVQKIKKSAAGGAASFAVAGLTSFVRLLRDPNFTANNKKAIAQATWEGITLNPSLRLSFTPDDGLDCDIAIRFAGTGSQLLEHDEYETF